MEDNKQFDYLDGVTDQGFENMGSTETAVPMLLIAQQLSDVAQAGKVPAGHFYNSITGKDYGDKLNVVVCHFQKSWVEWKPNAGGFVGRHEPNSIEVTGDIYSGMKRGENDVIETWMYLCILPDHPEDGYVLFQSTRGNLKYLKGWNTSLKNLRTPKNKPAPIYAAIWELKLGKDQNKQGKQYYSCSENGKSTITFVDWVPQAAYIEYVQPCRAVANQTLALADNSAAAAIESDGSSESDAF